MSICLSLTHPDQPGNDLNGAGAHGGVGDLGRGDPGVLKNGVGVKPDLPRRGHSMSWGMEPRSTRGNALPGLSSVCTAVSWGEDHGAYGIDPRELHAGAHHRHRERLPAHGAVPQQLPD